MPVTLAQAQVNTTSDIDYAVIDSMRRYDGRLLDMLVWDDVATPGATGAAAISYAYTRLTQAKIGQSRAYNNEYIPGTAKRERVSVDLKPFGDSFEIDRVLASLGPAASSEIAFQMQQAIIGTRMKVTREIIRGDAAVDPNTFNGLSKLLVGSTTEVAGVTLDISPTAITSQATALAALDRLDAWLATLVPSRIGSGQGPAPGALPPGRKAILTNTVGVVRLRALARWASLFTLERDDLGREVQRYKDWELIDLGDLDDATGPVIPTGLAVPGETDLYAVTFGLDGLHAASMAGRPLLQTWLPDFSTAGAVKLGEVEMGPMAVVLRSTKSAGVHRKVKVS